MIAAFFLSIFQCNPVKNYWTFGAPDNTCINEGAVTLAVGIINCLGDFICTILPMPLVAQLNMPRKQRIAVVILFSVGFVVTGAGIARTWYISKSMIYKYDQTWYSYPLWVAAAVEIHLGVVGFSRQTSMQKTVSDRILQICATAPVLRPLLSRIPLAFFSAASKVPRKWPGSSGYSKGSRSNPSSSLSQTIKSSQSRSITDSASRSRTHVGRDYVQSTRFQTLGSEQTHPYQIQEHERSHPPLHTLDPEQNYPPPPQEFELRQWEDIEKATKSRETRTSSREAIIGSDEEGEEATCMDGMASSDLNPRVSWNRDFLRMPLRFTVANPPSRGWLRHLGHPWTHQVCSSIRLASKLAFRKPYARGAVLSYGEMGLDTGMIG